MTALSDLRESIFKKLPTTITVGTDTIYVNKVWMDEPPKQVKYPAWLVSFLPEVDENLVSDRFEGKVVVSATVTDEPHTYAGETVTLVDERDIVAVQAVTGTAGGNPRTFVAGTDYDIVDDNEDGGLDGISWKVGGTLPDNGTQVLIDYTHKMLDTQRHRVASTAVVIVCATSPLETGQGKKPDNTGGATQQYRAIEVLEVMVDALFPFVERDLIPELRGKGIEVAGPLSPQPTLKIGRTQGLQRQVLFDAVYQQDVTLSQVRTVRTATTTTTVTP